MNIISQHFWGLPRAFGTQNVSRSSIKAKRVKRKYRESKERLERDEFTNDKYLNTTRTQQRDTPLQYKDSKRNELKVPIESTNSMQGNNSFS